MGNRRYFRLQFVHNIHAGFSHNDLCARGVILPRKKGLRFCAVKEPQLPVPGERMVITMKATLDRSGCISCGLCTETCPSVFRMAEDGLAEVYTVSVPADDEDKAEEAESGCPVSVIAVTKG